MKEMVNVDEVLKNELPVFVDFYTNSCGPCRMLAPVVEEISQEYIGKVDFIKVDAEKWMDFAIQNNVNAVPSLFIFKNGQSVATMVGFVKKEKIKAMIDGAIA